ncbi:hypothetical protein HFO28_02330 [Rhizobium leguminosarum]|uniref:hypothetical protein n=1 Tax=Rhizobium leguminosarum TaxID=384 RepID=UPI001C94852B|nr:hypothetical protein [Rhizobium leguminosarum]MBY5742443.1 hypothetical protein [Rhizobium leguminosarum]
MNSNENPIGAPTPFGSMKDGTNLSMRNSRVKPDSQRVVTRQEAGQAGFERASYLFARATPQPDMPPCMRPLLVSGQGLVVLTALQDIETGEVVGIHFASDRGRQCYIIGEFENVYADAGWPERTMFISRDALADIDYSVASISQIKGEFDPDSAPPILPGSPATYVLRECGQPVGDAVLLSPGASA